MSYTKEQIQDKLRTDVRWIERTLVVLYQRQTSEEQESGQTQFYNGVGFNGVDSRYLTYCSKWLLQGKHLSGKHLEKVKRILPKYWKQIQTIIEQNNR